MYHGTDSRVVSLIIKDGFKPSECQHGVKAVYLSPSIKYSAHPRYSKVVQTGSKYFQVVLEVRVKASLVNSFKGETMEVGSEHLIDPNFENNDEMEFLFASEKASVKEQDGILVTGIMMRALGHDPLELSESKWWTCWQSSDLLHRDYYRNV